MENTSLNINPARQDKFFFALGDIPSSLLLSPEEATSSEQIQSAINDKNYYNLAVRTAEIPGVSLGEIEVNTTFTALKETDMKPKFESFTTELKIDEHFLIYKLLVLWLFLIKNPEGYNQHDMRTTFEKTATDGILTMKNSMNESVIGIELYNIRPLSIPSIPLSYTDTGKEIYIEVTWTYDYYMPRKVTGEAYSLLLPEN